MTRFASALTVACLVALSGCTTPKKNCGCSSSKSSANAPKSSAAAVKPAELTDGRAILERSIEALKDARTVSYDADYKATAWISAFVPNVEGHVVMGEQSQWEIAKFQCDVVIKRADSEEVLKYSAGSDGDVYFIVDPKTRTAYRDMDPAVMGSNGRNVQRVLLGEFSEPEPFAEVLKERETELAGDADIAGEPCYEIVWTGEQPNKSQWFISKNDYLPRGVIRTYANQRDPDAEAGTTELKISKLVANPKFARDPFKLVVPKGFTLTDEFAP